MEEYEECCLVDFDKNLISSNSIFSGTFQKEFLFQNSLHQAVLFANSFLLVCLVGKGKALSVILM